MSLRSALFAASAFVAATNAHVTISKPVAYTADQVKIDKAAITADQFPCKSQYGFTVTTMNEMKVGESQPLEFDGSAVHGGGSCQLSYTTDAPPTKDSKFKTFMSIEGGCPGVDKTNTYNFTLPDSIPNGKGTFVWSWFAKMSGAPEFYMNCAPIDVSGGASDASGLDALPDMFVANIASTTCKSPLNGAVKFPNPGDNVLNGGTNDLADPTGDCGATGSSSGSSSGSSASAVASAPAASASAPAASAPAASASAPAASAPAASAPASAVQSTLATVATSAAAATSQAATATTVPTTGGNGNEGTGNSTSGSTSSGTCSSEGAIVCNGTTKFGICNGGSVVWQDVAPGTTCSNGTISKRSSMRIARHN